MSAKRRSAQSKAPNVEALEARLNELEETLRAIRQGEVDALVVSTPEGDRVFTLDGADHPYRVMVETINEGAATLTAGGEILYANRRFAEMLALPLERLIGSKLHGVVENLDCPTLDKLLERAQTAPQKEECLLRVAGGKSFSAFLSLSPLRGLGLQAICLIATDLTEVRSRRSELLETNERLKLEVEQRQHVENAFRQLTGRLLNLQDEERRRIARDLHDSTAQTLNCLVLNLAYIDKEAQLRGFPGASKMLNESMSLAQEAAKEVRDVSHLLYPPALDQMGLAAAIEWHAQRASDVSGIEITLDIPAEVPRLPREMEVALFRVLQESLENIRRHSGSRTAQVRLIPNGESIVLEIEDQGQGMPAGVFSEKIDNVATLGVGVAGMRERLRQLGGRVEIESGPEGTIVRAYVADPGAAAARKNAQETPLRVLVVDDSAIVRRVVSELLGTDPEFHVVGEAANGDQAVERAVELQPDIILLDITLPQMGGIDAARKIGFVVPNARIVAFSQDDSTRTVREARSAGAVGYVLKSDASRDLMRGIKSVIEGKPFLSSTVAKLFSPKSA